MGFPEKMLPAHLGLAQVQDLCQPLHGHPPVVARHHQDVVLNLHAEFEFEGDIQCIYNVDERMNPRIEAEPGDTRQPQLCSANVLSRQSGGLADLTRKPHWQLHPTCINQHAPRSCQPARDDGC